MFVNLSLQSAINVGGKTLNKKKLAEKGVKVILVGSLVGMGTFTYMPTAKAIENPTDIQEEIISNMLSALEIEGIPFDQTFSSEVLNYSATVGADVENISLLAKSSNQTATIMVNGIELTSGKAKDFALQSGVNTFTITVDDGINETVTYTLHVEKQESDDNLLTGISLSKASLSFDSSITAYTVSVANNVNTITVTPKVSDSNATVKVNGIEATSKGVKVILPVGKATVKIVVTAENGSKKTYTLKITRAAATTTETDDKDTSMEDSSGTSKPEKEPTKDTNKTQPSKGSNGDKTPSSDSVNSSVGEVPISGSKTSPTQAAPNVQKVASGSIQNATSGSANKVMSDESTNEAEEVNHAPVLDTLTVSNGSWNKAFDSEEYTYHIEVDKDVTSVKIGAIASESGATIKYEGESSQTVTIKDKAKTAISISVSKNGDRRTYVLVFEKDIDIEMDEEETVDDVKIEKDTEVEATKMSTSNKVKNDKSNTVSSQMKPMENGSTDTTSFWGKIEKFFSNFF